MYSYSQHFIRRVFNNQRLLFRNTRLTKRKSATLFGNARSNATSNDSATAVLQGFLAKIGSMNLSVKLCKAFGRAGLLGFVVSTQLTSVKSTSMEEQLPQIIQHVDNLYESNRMREALNYLEKYSNSTSAELLWRLARLCYKVGKYHSSDKEESKRLATKSLEYIKQAIGIDDANFACHKWMGIIISWVSDFEGYKKKIERSFEIRDHFVKAIELNPKDPTCRHLLGQWCYSVSSVPWYQKKLATMIFATPPSSSFQEALSHFEAAEKEQPGFYSTNWLFIGKCHLQLGQVQEGSKWLKKVADYQGKFGDDIEAKKEAKELLETIIGHT